MTQEEHYNFTWWGKKACIREADTPCEKVLVECREESVNFDTTQNLFIEGDNLDALKLLQESYLCKVKMIYIDPPYNTGRDFIYKDKFKCTAKNWIKRTGADPKNQTQMDGRFHSDWLSFIYPRLKIARNFLADDGVIFISIDDNEVYHLRMMMNEIFGEENFVGTIGWESKTKSQNTETSYNKLQPKIEYILCYTRQDKKRFNLITVGQKQYPLSDNKGNYRDYAVEVMDAGGERGRNTMIFPIRGILPPEGKQWQLGAERIDDYEKKGDLFLKDMTPYVKMRPKDERPEITQPFWAFFPKDMGTTESAKKEVNDIFGNKKHGFDTIKPFELVKRLVFHATNPNDIILDFFAGSSTTAHAVMQLNAEDGGNRKFIMVQIPEPCDPKSEAAKAGYATIAEISKERIRRAGKKILEVQGKTLNLDGKAPLDIGFKVLKVSDSAGFK